DRARVANDQVAPLERAEELGEPLGDTNLRQRAAPERLSHDRRVEQERTLSVGECVEAGGEEAADRWGARGARRGWSPPRPGGLPWAVRARRKAASPRISPSRRFASCWASAGFNGASGSAV